jgi:hypothetical protein
VPHRLKTWVFVGFTLAVAVGIGWGVYDWFRPSYKTPADLLRVLPRSNAVLFFADVRACRDAGLLAKLAGSKPVEEPDYERFVTETSFDYQKDVDAIAAAALPTQTFAVIRGRFDWKRLSKYATHHGGSCHNRYCQLPASKQNQWISFFPLRTEVMAIAVSPDPAAAYMLLPRRDTPEVQSPAYSVWISLPRRVFENSSSLPLGSQMLASAMSGASEVVLGLEGASSGPGSGSPKLNLRLDARCDSAAQAEQVENRLKDITQMVNSLATRGHRGTNSSELSSLLGSGTFSRAGEVVKGTWPVRQELLNSLFQ